jgi:hypothetical protein
MENAQSLYQGHRFPAVVISCAMRWYFRLHLTHRFALSMKSTVLPARFTTW